MSQDKKSAGKHALKSPLDKFAKVVGGSGNDDDITDKGEGITDKDDDQPQPLEQLPRFRPSQVLHDLNLDIVGQDDAKKVLAVALCDHIKRLRIAEAPFEGGEARVVPEKSNVLLIGPSGCGKTEIISTLADLLDVPFAKAVATGLTVAGYYGEDVEEVLARLYKNAGNDVRRAERGIVYIDEVDKLARPDNGNYGDDIRGKGVQQALLEIIRGTDVVAIKENYDNDEDVVINTSNILFVMSGSFEGLDKIVSAGAASIGFGASLNSASTPKLPREIDGDALIKFGLMAEFVGRMPIRATLDALTQAEMVRVLIEPRKSIIRQYVSLFAEDGLSLDFDEDALCAIAEKAMKTKTGVRALRSIMETLLRPLSFELPDKQLEDTTIRGVHITREYVLGEGEAQIIYGDPPEEKRKLRPIAAEVRKQLRRAGEQRRRK